MPLIAVIESLAPELISALEPLIMTLISSPNPSAAIAKAARAVEMDAADAAADAATDAALNALLKKAHS